MKIEPHETEIRGHWKQVGLKVVADSNAQRIDQLVTAHLKQAGRDDSGWELLYVDPDDGRFWELTYPEAEQHGGGPPMLRWLSAEEARKKYG
jgi:immunity protein 27 of polymorphic toxin system